MEAKELKAPNIVIGEKSATAFCAANRTWQDGTTPMYRDVDGTLWAMSGHSHMGHIAMYRGTCIDDMQVVPGANKRIGGIQTNFSVGSAEYAFNGIRYPEGVKPRGSIWPFGLYICPVTHRFFCLFHNESGWNGMGTAYDSYGLCDKPRGDSDFRHIGLMHSDDEGNNWTFDRWVLAAEEPCFSEEYVPDGVNAVGQKRGVISLGSGDFSALIDPAGEFIYLFYNIIRFDMDKRSWASCDVYLARSRRREDGLFGDFVKFCGSSFCESGILGRETRLVSNTWHPRVVYSKKLEAYLMISVGVTPGGAKLVDDVMQLRISRDLIHWSEPVGAELDGEPFGNHYLSMVSDSASGQPFVIEGDEFSILANHNGTDVMRYRSRFGGAK